MTIKLIFHRIFVIGTFIINSLQAFETFETYEAALEDLKKGYGKCDTICTTAILHNKTGHTLKLVDQLIIHGRDEFEHGKDEEKFEKVRCDSIPTDKFIPIVHTKKFMAWHGSKFFIVFRSEHFKYDIEIGFLAPYEEYTTSKVFIDVAGLSHFQDLYKAVCYTEENGIRAKNIENKGINTLRPTSATLEFGPLSFSLNVENWIENSPYNIIKMVAFPTPDYPIMPTNKIEK